MKIDRTSVFMLAYKLLIAVSIFSPERYGTPFKYAFFPLLVMLLCMDLRHRINQIELICVAFLVSIFWSTYRSTVYGVSIYSPAFRSLAIMIFFFAILSEVELTLDQLEDIKSWYETCVIFCGMLVLINTIRYGVDRYHFHFLFRQKDVNYLLAFMLPGCNIAIRKLFFEIDNKRKKHIVCIVLCVISIVLFETRAAFVTMMVMIAIFFMEKMREGEFTFKKLYLMFGISAVTMFSGILLLTNSKASRITNFSNYENDVRMKLWTVALNAFHRNRLMGSGSGASSLFSLQIYGLYSHNNFIDLLGDFGIVGAMFFALILYKILRVKKEKQMHIFSYAISFFLPLAFINGLQTIVFWLPMILLSHEHNCMKAIEEKGKKPNEYVKKTSIR